MPQSRRGRRLKVLVAATVVVPVAAVASAWACSSHRTRPFSYASRPRPVTRPSPSRLACGPWAEVRSPAIESERSCCACRPPMTRSGRTSAITGAFHLRVDGSVLRVERACDRRRRLEAKSDEERRDDHLRTMGLETDLHPYRQPRHDGRYRAPSRRRRRWPCLPDGRRRPHGPRCHSDRSPSRCTPNVDGRIEVVGTLSSSGTSSR